MFDSLTKIFEGRNINQKMNLRNSLKNLKIQNVETIPSYLTRVSQVKEQLEAVDEEGENVEIVMTTLNCLPRSWDSFIQGIFARRKLINFSRLWEECSQEEAREKKMGSEDQALTVHSKSSRTNYHKGKSSHHKSNLRRSNKDLSRIRCYTCDEKGHYARECPRNKSGSHKRKGSCNVPVLTPFA